MSALRRATVLAAFAWAAVTLPPAWADQPKPVRWWNQDWKYRKIVRVKFPKQGNDMPVNFFEPSKLLGERTLTGRITIMIEGRTSRPGKEVVVIDSAGSLVPARAYASGWDQQVTVLFKAQPKTADYYLYYGNPKADRTRLDWRGRSAYPIMMATVPVNDAGAIETPARACRAILKVPEVKTRMGAYSVNNSRNLFGLQPGLIYITLYSGLIYAPTDGTYEFAINAGGTAHFLIDGSLILTVRGGSRPAKTWKHKAAVKLTEGVHNFTILHGERSTAQGIHMGWRKPDQLRIALMTGSAFARSNYTPARVVGLEELGKEVTPFFTFERPTEAFTLASGEAVAHVKLNNLTRGDGLRYRWKVGALSFTRRSPRCFVPAGRENPITLEVFKGGRSVGTYTRPLSLRAIQRKKGEATFELLTCPNVCYAGERAKLTFRVTNLSDHSLPLRHERELSTGKSVTGTMNMPARGRQPVSVVLPKITGRNSWAQLTLRLWHENVKLGHETWRVVRHDSGRAELVVKPGRPVDGKRRPYVVVAAPKDIAHQGEHATLTFTVGNLANYPVSLRYEHELSTGRSVSSYVDLPPRDEQPVHSELPTPPADGSFAQVTSLMWLATDRMGVATVRAVRPGPRLTSLAPSLGHLIDRQREGCRTVIVTELEDESKLRRWALVKWIGRQFKSGPTTIMLFGDSMLNVTDSSGEESYVEILRKRLAGAGRTLTWVEGVRDAIVPCVADIPAFGAAVAKHAPDLVLISPGSRDALRGISRQQFARALDVLIDLARSQENAPGVAIISPPPLLSNPKMSEGLARAARTIAKQHHVPFVDIHKLIMEKEGWKSAYKQGADDEVYYLYPNAETHKEIAESVLGEIE